MKKIILSSLYFFTIFPLFSEQLYRAAPATLPQFALNGAYQVGVTTYTISKDNALNLSDFTTQISRPLTLEVWYPAEISGNNQNKPAVYNAVTRLHKPYSFFGKAFRDAKSIAENEFPLVVLSHGYTGDRTLLFYLGEHLASHGYVVASIDHTDSTTAEIDFRQSPLAGFVSTIYNRAQDQQFILDYLTSTKGKFSDIIDKNKAGLIGYSMGGFGAINTIGGCYQLQEKNLIALGFQQEQAKNLLPVFNFCNAGKSDVDSRWKAMVAFAPWGQELNMHSQESLAKIKIPTLYVSGDQDDISGFEAGVKKLYNQTSKQDNYLLVYHNARHNIAPHPAPSVAFEHEDDLGHYYEPSWSTESLNHINKHFALVFLDCYVKNKQQQCQNLPSIERATQYKRADGSLSPAWPGFKSRWATGMSFYRADTTN